MAKQPGAGREQGSWSRPEHLATVAGDDAVAEEHVAGGGFVITRPQIGPLNHGPTDEATDACDTIDWPVKHTPESNRRVGVLGISYDGWRTPMALLHPHPALRAAVPVNMAVDGWMSDDWFHDGVFRPVGWA